MGGEGDGWIEGGEAEEENGNEELTNSAPYPRPYIHPYALISAESRPRTASVTCCVWTGEYPGYDAQLAGEHPQHWEFRLGWATKGLRVEGEMERRIRIGRKMDQEKEKKYDAIEYWLLTRRI
jgi:hypothetical protein